MTAGTPAPAAAPARAPGQAPAGAPAPEAGFAETIGWTIGQAGAAAAKGRRREAVAWFALCRTLLETRSPAAGLTRRIDGEAGVARAEADRARAILLARAAPDARSRVVIVADSLGLPRPEDRADFEAAVEKTYPALTMARAQAAPKLGGVAVDAHCQRFFTTDDAVGLMRERPAALDGAHVLVHLGLNDCAVRMFLTAQRLACALLPKEIADQVVDFARVHRGDIVRTYPQHQYVPLERFRANLHAIAGSVRRAGGASLTFCTVVVVPMRFWAATPDVCRTFTGYNLAIMETAAAVGARVLDVDRIMWQHGVAGTLNKDGMHLSPRGHELLAENYVRMLADA